MLPKTSARQSSPLTPPPQILTDASQHTVQPPVPIEPTTEPKNDLRHESIESGKESVREKSPEKSTISKTLEQTSLPPKIEQTLPDTIQQTLQQNLPNSILADQPPIQFATNLNGKKAVHVKWAGKTIALGTFPQSEADEKCARAKALTRAWRSTMRPKPSREWVMLELERLQVRVVSGRLGRKGTGDGTDDGTEDDDDDVESKRSLVKKKVSDKKIKAYGLHGVENRMEENGTRDPGLGEITDVGALAVNGADMNNGTSQYRQLLGRGSAAAYEAARADHLKQSLMAQSKSKSSTDKDKLKEMSLTNNGNFGGLSLLREENQDIAMGVNNPNGRLSGATSSASNNLTSTLAPHSLIGSGGQASGGGMPQLGLSVNPNQHYEMLKLHHMNLLNEIQETTLMMNLYQQQQLQQQQQQQRFQQNQLDQHSLAVTADQQLALQLAQQPTGTGNPFLESLYCMGAPGGMAGQQSYNPLHQQTGFQQANQQVGLGLGGSQGGGAASNQMQALLRQQNLLSGTMLTDPNSLQRRLNLTQQSPLLAQDQPLTLQEQEELCQARLQRLKQDIAERQRVADVLEGASPSLATKQNFVDDGAPYKRQRVDVDHN